MSQTSRSYQAELLKALKDPAEAREYLNAALEERSEEIFMLALRNVAEAQGVQDLAEISFDAPTAAPLRPVGDSSHLARLSSVLDLMGFKLAIEARGARSAA